MPLPPYCPTLRTPHNDKTFCIYCGTENDYSLVPSAPPTIQAVPGDALSPIELPDSPSIVRTLAPSHNPIARVAERAKDIGNRKVSSKESLKLGFNAGAPALSTRAGAKPGQNATRYRFSIRLISQELVYNNPEDEECGELSYGLRKEHGDDIYIPISLWKFDTLAYFVEMSILPKLSPIRYPKFVSANLNTIQFGTGKDSEKKSKRIFIDEDLDNNTQTLFDELEKDKEGCATLHLIYEHVRKSNFDTVLDTPIPTVPQGKAAKGKGRGKGKGKSQGPVLKKVKTEPTNDDSDIKAKSEPGTNASESELSDYPLPSDLIANYPYHTRAQGNVKSEED